MSCKKTALFFMLTAAACFFSCRVDIDGTGQMGGTGDSGEKPEDPSVEYSVSHLLQNINDDGYTEADCETLIGKPDCMTEAVQKDYEGFILKDSVPNCKISSDGSTIVKIHYDRKLYEVVFDAGEGVFKGAGENGEDVRTVTRKFRHAQKIEPPEASSTKDGYKVQWPDFGTAGSGSVNSYTASWESGLADYGIRSYFESVSGDFEEAEDKRSVKSGKPGTETSLGEIDAQSFTGFTFDHADNTVISEDGISFVSFYYKRNSYTLTFDAGEGRFTDGKSTAEKSFKFGEAVEIPAAELEGYSASWSGVPSTCPARSETYTITWIPGEATRYTIKHFVQNLDGSTWTEKEADRRIGQGKTGSATDFKYTDAKSYEGFSFQKVDNATIKGDGSATVSFYYTRKSYTLTFDAGEGKFSDGKSTAEKSFKFEETVEIPEAKLEGYSPSWSTVPNICPAKSASYTVTWIPGEATQYTIKHFVQNLDGSTWTEKVDDTKIAYGKTGAQTSHASGEAKKYEGFSFQKVDNATIKGDGSATVSFYYTRNSYTLTFDAGKGKFADGKSTAQKTYKFGETIIIPEAKLSGYSASWSAVPSTCPAQNVTYSVVWIASETTPYKIVHKRMNVDGKKYSEYTADTRTANGKTDSKTNYGEADANSYTGFTFSKVENATIKADGTAVVTFYYTRNKYTITFVAEGGTFGSKETLDASGNAVKTLYYEANITAPSVTRTDYSAEWPDFGPCTGDATYTATWIAHVPYTVEHHKQNANDDGETITVQTLKGKPGAMTNAKSNAKANEFTLREPINQLEIAADGSTVVKIYYNRKTYDITFDAGDGVFLGAGENGEDVSTLTKTYRYYQKITAPKFFKDGYVGTWSPAFSATVTKNVAYTVTWEEGDPDTNYNVYHIQQATNGTYGTTPKEKETRTGLGGSMTKFTAADAKSYTGFTLDRIENTIISSDGKATVKFYYKRNIVKLTFDAGEGTFSDGSHVKEFTGLYGAAVSVEKPTRDFWICTAWFLESSTAHLAPEFGYSDIKSFPLESTKYEAKWDATFKLTAAKDDKGNDVLSNFSTQFETGIEIHDQDFKLNGGSNPRWLSANPTIIGCRFYHKDASKSGDDKHYNAFWGTDGKVDLSAHKISGTFYKQKVETKLSDDYNTITFTINCKALYTEKGGSLWDAFKNFPFGKNGSYTLTFTRK